MGKTARKSAEIDLKDANGRLRLKLLVTADGEASIQFLDAHGRVAMDFNRAGEIIELGYQAAKSALLEWAG